MDELFKTLAAPKAGGGKGSVREMYKYDGVCRAAPGFAQVCSKYINLKVGVMHEGTCFTEEDRLVLVLKSL